MFGINWFWWVAGVGVLVPVLALAGQWVRRRWWRNRFVTSFGFAPEKDWQGRLFQTPEVERELSRLAWEFDSWVKQEDKLVGAYLAKKYGNAPLRDLESWKSIRANLAHAKKEFWAAHNAAQHAAFGVEEKYTDYLR